MSARKPALPLRLVKLYLDLVRILVWIGAAVFLICMIYALFFATRVDHPPSLEVPLELKLDQDVLRGSGFGLPVHEPRLADGVVTLRFGTADKLAWLVYGLAALSVIAVLWYAVRQMRALVRDVLVGRAFTGVNALRLRRLGLLALGWQIVAPWAQYVWSRFVLARFDLATDTISAPLNYDLEPIVLALAVLVLAEIFGEAARLQEESDLTV